MKQFSDIPLFPTWKSIQKIEKGWSNDTKYHIIDNNNQEYLLRTSPIEAYDNKKEEFDIVKTLYNENIPMSKPIDFGTSQGKIVYSLLSYIPGEQAEIVLPTLSEKTQYTLGYQIGNHLKQIHQKNIQHDTTWETNYKSKIQGRIDAYHNCGYKLTEIDHIIQYITKHMDLLHNRPTCLHHGDYHAGNMIISPDESIHIIDFNRVKTGDPYYEFNRIYFSYRVSPQFAKGQIDGYFDNNIPESFFQYMKFYILSVIVGNIAWAQQFGQEDVDFAIAAVKQIYNDYNQLSSTIPNWYKEL